MVKLDHVNAFLPFGPSATPLPPAGSPLPPGSLCLPSSLRLSPPRAMPLRGSSPAGPWGRLLLVVALAACAARASEITFELPDNAKQCFYEEIAQGTKCTLEFQVITGGHYDVDCRLEDPEGTVLYKEMKKQYDSFTFTASRNGTYKFCFSNEFSTFTHKTVYFDFQVGEDPPLFPSENRVTALTQMESACVSIHEALKSVIDYQTHFRLREAQGRSRAEDLNTRVAYWSIGEAIILLVVSIGQVFLLKSFFSDKRTTTTRVGS
ncbi:transmembrane emp24 domain-containing protein 7 [Limosa lapponica baueri]|uniref:Transmembrane emp24 domain-containing protein 7 n=1 Tax=Limosa lapponica baueri TaxID=1758121 RepID=A0A2I0UN96_LIMLA|nr:transmembrane emp24 domain-containing protein 7 [Limosa lapponica baueri]